MPVFIDNDNWMEPKGGGWGGSEEIDINVDAPVEVDCTRQFVLADDDDNEPDKLYEYQVTTCPKRQDEHVVEYHIHYTEEGNEDLIQEYGKDSFRWGIHILILKKDEDSGESFWKPEKMDDPGKYEKKMDGP